MSLLWKYVEKDPVNLLVIYRMVKDIKFKIFKLAATAMAVLWSIPAYQVCCAKKGHVAIPDTQGRAGEVLPDVWVLDLENNPTQLHSFLGKPVVIAFMDLENPYTRAQIIPLERLRRNIPSDKLEILAVHLDHRPVVYIRNYLANRPVSFPIYGAWENLELAFNKFAAFPTMIFVQSDGIISIRMEGYQDYEKLLSAFRMVSEAVEAGG